MSALMSGRNEVHVLWLPRSRIWLRCRHLSLRHPGDHEASEHGLHQVEVVLTPVTIATSPDSFMLVPLQLIVFWCWRICRLSLPLQL